MNDIRARRTAVLTAAARAKSEAKAAAADQAIRRLVKKGEPVTFQSVQREAGVSHAFLYGNAELRSRIERLRDQGRPKPPPPDETGGDNTIIQALTSQITHHAIMSLPLDHPHIKHRSPEMTMRYAATLATTAEREFLAMVKIGRYGRQAGMDRRDMLDILQLDRRTDRVLPNGYCLLPPVRSCDKGNACHGCDHFATDRSHLPEIGRQLAATEQLIRQRQEQHAARYGEPMSDSNIWLEQRHAEVRSMRLEISALEALGDETAVVRGPGVCGRAGYQDPGPVNIAITPKPEKQ